MGEQDVDTYDRDDYRYDDYNDGDQWTQKELDEMKEAEEMHKKSEFYKCYQATYTRSHFPNFKCPCGNWNYEDPCHTHGTINGVTREPCKHYENHQLKEMGLHSDAFWLINEFVAKYSDHKMPVLNNVAGGYNQNEVNKMEKKKGLKKLLEQIHFYNGRFPRANKPIPSWTLSGMEIVALCNLISRYKSKMKPEVIKSSEAPKVMNMDIQLDDWFLDDIAKFTKNAVKTCLTLEEKSFLSTKKMDDLILDICNRIFQELYKEVRQKQ